MSCTPCQKKRIEDIITKLKVLQAAKKENWITSNGQHILIKDGQTKEEAAKEHFEKFETKQQKDQSSNTSFPSNTTISKPTPKKHVELLQDAWKRIPKEHTDGIKEMEINALGHNTDTNYNCGGEYDFDKKKVVMHADGLYGLASTQRHEVQHHRWMNHRSEKERSDWKDGVTKIRLETGMGPTVYADSHMSKAQFKRVEKRDKILREMKEALKTGAITPEMYHGAEYTEAEKAFKKYQKLNEKRPNSTHESAMETYAEKLKSLNEEYEQTTPETRRTFLEYKLAEAEPSNHAIDDIYYNECHSEVGAYIYEEKSLREYSANSESKRINESVIDKYVKLYKEVFKD